MDLSYNAIESDGLLSLASVVPTAATNHLKTISLWGNNFDSKATLAWERVTSTDSPQLITDLKFYKSPISSDFEVARIFLKDIQPNIVLI